MAALSRLSLRTRIVLVWLLCLLVLGVYWLQLYRSHQAQWQELEQQAALRADQTAQALSHHTERTLRKLRFIVQHLGEHWTGGDEADFRRVIHFAQAALPAGALEQVAIADHEGRIVFSSLSRPGVPPANVSIADRAHFRIHVEQPLSDFHVGTPVQGRVSGKWSVQLSSPLRKQGVLNWVLVASVDAGHLSEAYRQVFPDPADVVLLINEDGDYLTRNHAIETVLGKRVPADREFFHATDKTHGNYFTRAPVDGVERYYSWVRVPGFPLVLSLGLGRDKVIAPLQAALHASHVQHLVSLLLLLFAGWRITRLVLLRSEQTRSLAETQERLRQALDAVRDGLWEWRVADGRMQWDAQCRHICERDGLGLPASYEEWLALLHADDLAVVDASLQEHVARGGGEPLRIECRIRTAQPGIYRGIELRGRLLGEQNSADAVFIGTCSDITARYQTQQMLEVERLRMLTLLEKFDAGVLLEDASQRVVMANKPLCHLLDLELEPAALVDLAHDELLARLHPMRAGWLPEDRHNDSRRSIEVIDEILQRVISVDWVPIHHGNETLGYLWLLHDITRRRRRERELALLASTDGLTGLPNRRSFMAVLEAWLGEGGAESGRGAVMMLDIDHFKRINDAHGHPVGDEVLQRVAKLLQGSLRDGDECARLGGEEFAVLARELSLAEALRLAERIRVVIANQVFEIGDGLELGVTVSIGVAELGEASVSKLLMAADQALYRAKTGGRNQVCAG